MFVENNLKDKFIINLEPFILSSKLREHRIPDQIIDKLIRHYETHQQLKTLEKII